MQKLWIVAIAVLAIAVLRAMVSTPAAESTPEPPVPACIEHAVQPGDSVESIADEWHVTVWELTVANPSMIPETVAAGMVVCVPEVHVPHTPIRVAFGDDALGEQALTVARCVSGMDPSAHRSDVPGEAAVGDRGLFQINQDEDFWLVEMGVIDGPADLFVASANARAARLLYDREGWSAWYQSIDCHGLS